MYLFYDVSLVFDIVIWWWGMKYVRELRFNLKILDFSPVSTTVSVYIVALAG